MTVRERWLAAFALAGCGGTLFPLPLYFLKLWPMRLSVPFLTLPALLLLIALPLFARRIEAPAFFSRFSAGFVGGLVGTIAYDAVRAFGLAWRFQGFAVIHKFGLLITGRSDLTIPVAAVGWTYHVLNGGVFGITYALVAGRAAVGWGIAWGLLLEAAMIATYPSAFSINLGWGSVGLAVSLLGHVAYGTVLAMTVRRLLPDTTGLFDGRPPRR